MDSEHSGHILAMTEADVSSTRPHSPAGLTEREAWRLKLKYPALPSVPPLRRGGQSRATPSQDHGALHQSALAPTGSIDCVCHDSRVYGLCLLYTTPTYRTHAPQLCPCSPHATTTASLTTLSRAGSSQRQIEALAFLFSYSAASPEGRDETLPEGSGDLPVSEIPGEGEELISGWTPSHTPSAGRVLLAHRGLLHSNLFLSL